MASLPDINGLSASDLIAKLECVATAGLCRMFNIVESRLSNVKEDEFDLGDIRENGLDYKHSISFSNPVTHHELLSFDQIRTEINSAVDSALNSLKKILGERTLVLHFEDCQV